MPRFLLQAGLLIAAAAVAALLHLGALAIVVVMAAAFAAVVAAEWIASREPGKRTAPVAEGAPEPQPLVESRRPRPQAQAAPLLRAPGYGAHGLDQAAGRPAARITGSCSDAAAPQPRPALRRARPHPSSRRHACLARRSRRLPVSRGPPRRRKLHRRRRRRCPPAPKRPGA